MALTGITIDNYRVFEEPTHLELRPLTILTGPNNSGKSSIVKWLQFLSKNFADNKLTSLSTEGTDFHSVRSILPKQKDFGFKLFFKSYDKPRFEGIIYNSIYEATGQDRERIDHDIENITINGEMEVSFVYHSDIYKDIYNLHTMELNINKSNIFTCEYINNVNQFECLFNINNFLNIIFIKECTELDEYLDDGIRLDDAIRYPQDVPDEELCEILNVYESAYCLLKEAYLGDSTDYKENIIVPFFYLLPKYLNFIEHKSYELIMHFYVNVASFNNLQFWMNGENIREIVELTLEKTKHGFKYQIDKNWPTADLEDFFEDFFENLALYFTNIISSFFRSYIHKLTTSLNYEHFEFNTAIYERDNENSSFSANTFYGEKPDFFMSDDEELQSFLKASLDRFDLQKVYLNKNDEELNVKVTTRRSGVSFDLADVGLGYSKIIQLIYGLARNIALRGSHRWENGAARILYWYLIFFYKPTLYDNYRLLTFEEPENSLHPDYQSLLADVFVDYTNLQAGKTVIIETHSEYFIRKLQYLVKTGKLCPNHVIIHYFGKQPHPEETVRSIEILPNGRLSQEFGPGFFDEAARLISLLYEPQMEN